MLTAVLIGLIGALGVMDFQFGSLYINRPIVLGPLVGLVLGDVTQGLIIGANLELFFTNLSLFNLLILSLINSAFSKLYIEESAHYYRSISGTT